MPAVQLPKIQASVSSMSPFSMRSSQPTGTSVGVGVTVVVGMVGIAVAVAVTVGRVGTGV